MTPSQILFIADGTLDRPLLHSQGLPLLRRLAALGVRCFVQSYERDAEAQSSPLGRDLAARAIEWAPVLVAARPSGLERAEVILRGLREAAHLCRREAIEVVHCRSYRAAVVGCALKHTIGTAFVFDMRGFLIDEQLLSGRWQPTGPKYRVARAFERWCLEHADAVVTTSPQFSARVLALPYLRPGDIRRVIAIPNCVDTQRFRIDAGARNDVRARMGWAERTVVTFVGEARGRHGFADVFAFFDAYRRRVPAAFLALLVYGDTETLRQEARQRGLRPDDFCIVTVPPAEMPAYMNAADLGIFFRKGRPFTEGSTGSAHLDRYHFTQEIASPVKFAEYLACGVPVLINSGVGDTARIIATFGVGVVAELEAPGGMERCAQAAADLLSDPEPIRARCREAAEKELSLDLAVHAYLRVYRQAVHQENER